MASLSPNGERAVLALIAEQYAEIVDLREQLAAQRQARADDAAVFTSALELRDATAPGGADSAEARTRERRDTTRP